MTCRVVFLGEQLSIKTNWSQTVSAFHGLIDFFSIRPWGGGGQEQSTARTAEESKAIWKAQFVIVDQYKIQYCVPDRDSDSDVNFMSL